MPSSLHYFLPSFLPNNMSLWGTVRLYESVFKLSTFQFPIVFGDNSNSVESSGWKRFRCDPMFSLGRTSQAVRTQLGERERESLRVSVHLHRHLLHLFVFRLAPIWALLATHRVKRRGRGSAAAPSPLFESADRVPRYPHRLRSDQTWQPHRVQTVERLRESSQENVIWPQYVKSNDLSGPC